MQESTFYASSSQGTFSSFIIILMLVVALEVEWSSKVRQINPDPSAVFSFGLNF